MRLASKSEAVSAHEHDSRGALLSLRSRLIRMAQQVRLELRCTLRDRSTERPRGDRKAEVKTLGRVIAGRTDGGKLRRRLHTFSDGPHVEFGCQIGGRPDDRKVVVVVGDTMHETAES